MASTSQPLILEYKKRRFDGGNERDVIEQIELQQTRYEQQKANVHHHAARGPQPINPMRNPMVNPHRSRPQPQAPVQNNAAQPVVKKATIKEKLYRALVIPYIELILGLSGVLVGNIMIISMMQDVTNNNVEALDHERQALIQHSWTVVRNSTFGIISSPWQALKAITKHN